ncbi:hypothetical protein Q5P01_015711 [Channa striata]|uniref:Uncharacterized protein n=1 Tax=Channa striata TaxID=64152 RepID=A0AA88SJ12_CHASR|nr:hypothetical protein Q5P01_015711 [Channa striata]
MCAGKSEQYALREDGRACGVKLCSPAPVTVSDHVIITAALKLFRLGAVKGQFASGSYYQHTGTPVKGGMQKVQLKTLQSNVLMFCTEAGVSSEERWEHRSPVLSIEAKLLTGTFQYKDGEHTLCIPTYTYADVH